MVWLSDREKHSILHSCVILCVEQNFWDILPRLDANRLFHHTTNNLGKHLIISNSNFVNGNMV